MGLALTFDVYQPDEPNGAGVLYMNSGGYVSPYCDFHTEFGENYRLLADIEMEEADPYCREFGPRVLVDDGFTVFVVRHGSSPRFLVPDAVSDVRRAVRFIRDAASDYGVDPGKLGLWGGSAGGHLSLLLGSSIEIRNSDPSEDFELVEGRIAAVVAFFPVSDYEAYIEAIPEVVDWFPAMDFPAEQRRELSPVDFASADDPPTLIIHGDQDAVVPIVQGELMLHALQDAGVESELIVIEGAEHGFTGPDADFAQAESLSWFRRHLVP